MKLHIKRVLNMHFNNATVDKYISSIFNLNKLSDNPIYQFRLPNNRTLVFRKSDFTAAVFPNITNVNKFIKSSENLQVSSSSKHPVKVKSEEVLDELRHESLTFENNLNADDYDENMKKIVEENVRSEKEFIELMNGLNKDEDDEDIRDSYHKATKPLAVVNTRFKKPAKVVDEWEELGLSGWSGSVAGSKDKLPKREK